MTSENHQQKMDTLRFMAEQLVANQPPHAVSIESESIAKLLNELQVYQAELEIQNQELRKVQTDLEINRNKYYELFDLAPVGYFLLDASYRIQQNNIAGLEQLQMNRAELKNKPLLNFIRTKDHQQVVTYLNSLVANRKRDAIFVDIKRSDGSNIHVRIDGIKSESTALRGDHILLTVSDLTELRSTQAALQESESLYRSLVYSSEDHIFMLSLDGYFLASNDRVGHFNKARGLHLLGRNLTDIYPAAEAARYVEKLNHVVTTRKAISFEHQQEVDGATRYHVDRLYPIYKNNTLCAVGGICHDITAQKKAQVEKQILEKQLRQTQKLEAIGNLAGGIAHDFNNLLSSIIGFTEIALGEAERGSFMEDNLQEVFAAGKRARELVAQILAFARKSDEDIQPVEVRSITEEALKLVHATIPTTIEIRSRLNSASRIMGNPTQVHQIIMNLATNAAQAMEDAGGVLEVTLADRIIDNATSAGLDLSPGHYVVLQVSDSGAGMPPETIRSIFEPYFTTKSQGKGTGMGLAVVHGIVQNYGGRIQVESEVGKGSTFTLFIPATGQATLPHASESDELPCGTEHILLVDDEAAVAKVGRLMLESAGYRVTTCGSGMAALALIDAQPDRFDLVITDMSMPSMSGTTLAGELQRANINLPVILLTGFNKDLSKSKASTLGIKGLAQKPINRATLASLVRQILDEAHAEN